jgi:hypothetical protein
VNSRPIGFVKASNSTTYACILWMYNTYYT